MSKRFNDMLTVLPFKKFRNLNYFYDRQVMSHVVEQFFLESKFSIHLVEIF